PNRRKLLAGGAAVLATLGGLKALSLVPGRDGSPKDDAPSNPETSPSRTPTPKASPTPPPTATRLWRKHVTDFFPDLAAAGDVLVVSTNDDVSGLAPRTGKTLWKHATAFGPAVAGDVVYVVDADGRWPVSALRAATGATLWTYPVAFGETPGTLIHTGSVVCFGKETVRALGASDGQSRWTSKSSAEYGLAAGAGILAARGDTALTALDVADGRTRWTYRMRWTDDTPGRSTAYIAGGTVFVFDEDGALHALDAKTGAFVWKRPLVAGPYQLQARDGVLYLSGASILAVRAATGETLWSQRLGGDEGAPYGGWNSLGLTGDTLYVGCTNKTVYALDAAGGHVLWSSPADMTHSSGPVAVDGVVCVGLKDGYVEALAPPTPNGGPSAGT
ncbi:hypothetical protein QR77_20460, partial [Streptomyces sp. 150FB]|uniref:outer membrane protein assembly factor BamB family protein n=1 Tax=Streptomyces sp. 150FB TaxID=1576605 RepID=UPI0005892530